MRYEREKDGWTAWGCFSLRHVLGTKYFGLGVKTVGVSDSSLSAIVASCV